MLPLFLFQKHDVFIGEGGDSHGGARAVHILMCDLGRHANVLFHRVEKSHTWISPRTLAEQRTF